MSEKETIQTVVRVTTGRGNHCEDWESAWAETPWLKARIGLLYGLPKERDNKLWPWSISKLLWCFDSSQTEWKFEGGNSEDVYEAKKSIARTALSVLNRALFSRNGSIYERREYWVNLFHENIGLVESFVYFFRPGNRGLENFPAGVLDGDSLPHDVREFILCLCGFIWNYEGRSKWGNDPSVIERLSKLRPQVIEILCSIGSALGFFMSRFSGGNYDYETLMKLEEIALRAKTRYYSDHNKPERLVNSVAEAVHAGSHAAQTLTILHAHKLVQDKFDEITRLERERTQAEQKLKELQKS